MPSHRSPRAFARPANDHGLTQEQVSELSGVHPTEISRIENGQRDSQISTVFKLAKAFGLTPGEFIDRSWMAPDDRARG